MSLQSVQNQPTLKLPAHSTTGQISLDEFDDDERNYPVVTEDEMGETFKHYDTISTLYTLLQTFFAARADVSVLVVLSSFILTLPTVIGLVFTNKVSRVVGKFDREITAPFGIGS